MHREAQRYTEERTALLCVSLWYSVFPGSMVRVGTRIGADLPRLTA